MPGNHCIGLLKYATSDGENKYTEWYECQKRIYMLTSYWKLTKRIFYLSIQFFFVSKKSMVMRFCQHAQTVYTGFKIYLCMCTNTVDSVFFDNEQCNIQRYYIFILKLKNK